MSLAQFHPAVAAWFRGQFQRPTDCQTRAWAAIRSGRHALIAAPTGSGKTLAAFLAAIDDLIAEGQQGVLPDEVRVVYVSPLKALSNDVQRNLELPLAGIAAELQRLDLPAVPIRSFVRTGDTPAYARTLMARIAPHIVVTTPESLYILLTSESGRRLLASTRTVIVDEIHAVAASKRGMHLALSLERLKRLTGNTLKRIGLSATQRPIEEIARLLLGTVETDEAIEIIDLGHARERDIRLEMPSSPLEAVMSGEVWAEIYDRLSELIKTHRTTLVFVNTRRMAERVARYLSERIGEEYITSHHGSLAREQRETAEKRLKNGELKALVATASLELGIDIGDVDLVCQLGSPHSIAAFLQRVGRSGHTLIGIPKGRLFPLSRDDLVECAALLSAAAQGDLDRLEIPPGALDVLAQQLVAMVAAEEWDEAELFACVRQAWPYRELSREDFSAVLALLANGYSPYHGPRSAYVHRDGVHGKLRARRGARLTAMTSGGTIPDMADYEVREEPSGNLVGTLNEDFAIESLAGDIFQLGNTSWRILRVETGVVRVEDAHGQPPNMPFWFGEAPARSAELSAAVSQLRTRVETALKRADDPAPVAARAAVTAELIAGLDLPQLAAEQLVDYLAAAGAALGALPTHNTLILERFFDESGGMQLVLHSPYGGRINRAWGLALRKRFCRQFNFELQAAAIEDAIVLSLSDSHSFPLAEVFHYLHPATVREVLTQAVLAAPMFVSRWRWNAACSLALPRFRGGRKVPPRLQRMLAEDLIAHVFPDQIACAENLAGEREVPDHPLVRQTLSDCLTEAMDIEGLERLLRDIEADRIRLIAVDLTEPSPLAQEILTARPYAFLDDAPLEERRTQAVYARRWLDPQSAGDLGRLDPQAIAQVRQEAWPEVQTADEMHDALMLLGFVTEAEARTGWPASLPEAVDCAPRNWQAHLDALAASGRAMRAGAGDTAPWSAVERLAEMRAANALIATPAEHESPDALKELIRSRLTGLGPVTLEQLALDLAADAGPGTLPPSDYNPLILKGLLPEAPRPGPEKNPNEIIYLQQTSQTSSEAAAAVTQAKSAVHCALLALESEGFVLRGRFTGTAHAPEAGEEWCERRLLARIHRLTIKSLRREIEPISRADFGRFLARWQHADPATRQRGPRALLAVLEQLAGFAAPAAAWEREILPLRVSGYDPRWLDDLCRRGTIAWLRANPPMAEIGAVRPRRPIRTTPIALVPRRQLGFWQNWLGDSAPPIDGLTAEAQATLSALRNDGALFFGELLAAAGLSSAQLQDALAELVAAGLISCDSFAGLRHLLRPARSRRAADELYTRFAAPHPLEEAGRWAIARRAVPAAATDVEPIARALLARYGLVCKPLLRRETALPPWWDLLKIYRQLEARGEIRGGRFIAGIAGEQYALPEALVGLRAARGLPPASEPVAFSAADPLHIPGIQDSKPSLALHQRSQFGHYDTAAAGTPA